MQAKRTKETVIVPADNQDGYFPPLDDQALLDTIFDAAKRISPYALYELATDPYPPKVVQEVIEAVCMLLGIQSDWNEVKKLIEHEKLTTMIQEFHPEGVPDIYLEQISAIANLDEMQVVNLEKQSLATGQLGEWIHAIAIYYDIKHKPMIYSFMCEEPEEAEPEPLPVQILEPIKKEPIKKEEPVKKEEPKKEVPTPPRIVSIKEALESIKNLNKQDIVEVRGYKKPPAGVLLVLEALCILFDSMKMEKKGYNQIVYEPNYRKLLENTDAFIRKVLNWDYDKISKDKVKKLREYIVKPEFELEKVKKASVAAASFSLLIISIVQKFDQPQPNQATA